MSAVIRVTNAISDTPLPPVKAGPASGTPIPVDHPADTADISLAGVREAIQLGRIAHGVNSGHLTESQAKTLGAEEEALHDQIKQDKAANGGTLSSNDRLQVEQDLNRISEQIYDATHKSPSPGVVGPPTPAPGSIINVAG